MIKVLTEWQTVQAVAAGRLSLSRWGDGEAKCATERSAKTQPANPSLAKRLRRLLLSPPPNVLVAIPRVWPTEPPLATPGFWPQHRWIFEKYCAPGHVWGSSFISRRDSWPIPDESAYWMLLRSIWADRPVLLLAGSRKGRRTVTGGLLDNAASVDVLEAPRYDAFASYDALLADCWLWAQQQRDPIVIAALGATATVLAADLAKDGIQCLDLGHAAQAHARMDPAEDEAA